MKLNYLALLLFGLLFLGSCKKDCPKYKDYEVDFYTRHESFEINPPVFETVTEQVLLKPAHRQGATFESATEQVRVKPAITRHEIATAQELNIVVNAETNTIAAITCFYFFSEVDFIEIDVPAEYQTIARQRLLSEGTGPEVPASYGTLTSQRLLSDSEIVKVEGERTFNRVAFRIPDHMTIREYLQDQFAQQSIVDCEEGNAYRIEE